MNNVKEVIAERENTHGDYLVNARITWEIKKAMESGSRWSDLHPAQKETLSMIAHKIHRIVNGDPMFHDHWLDIAGYSQLILDNWDRIKYSSSGAAQARLPGFFEPFAEPVAARADTSAPGAATPIAGASSEVSTAVSDGEQSAPSDYINDRTHQRQPIAATFMEFRSFEGLIIPTGSMAGCAWECIYKSQSPTDGRFHMLSNYHEEYGI